jgi:Lambda phage tail tube protein, TTP
MSQNATLTQGTKLYRQNPSTLVYEAVPEVSSITGPDITKSEIKQTDFDSTAEEYSGGLVDFGRMTVDLYLRLDVAMHATIYADVIDATSPKRTWRLDFTNGKKLTFSASVFGLPMNLAANESVKATMTLRLSGLPVLS